MSFNVTTCLSDSFPKATSEVYFHYIMKNCRREETFKSNRIIEMLVKCTLEGKAPPLERKSVHDWTPLHVAAISGNAAGISFLLAQGVLAHTQDSWGKTPMDYCQELHPDLKHFFIEAQNKEDVKTQFSQKVGFSETEKSLLKTDIIEPLLKTWKVELSENDFCYQDHSHDFGIEIEKLLFLAPNGHIQAKKRSNEHHKIEHFADNIKQIAEEEGFEIDFTIQQYCPRDHLIMLCDGTRILPSSSDNIKKAIQKNESFCCLSQNKTTYATFQRSLVGRMGAVNKRSENPKEDFSKHFDYPPQKTPSLRFYFEGGNHFIATNAHGNKQLVIGSDTLRIAHLQMRLDKVFNDPLINLKGQMELITKDVSLEQLRKTLQEMYLEGFLSKTGKTPKGYICKEELLQLTSVVHRKVIGNQAALPMGTYAEAAEDAGFYVPISLSDTQVLGLKDIAVKFLAERSITQELVARSFGIERDHIFYLAQAGYHLDTFIKPGPKGSFFVQNYQFVVDLLSSIEANAMSLDLCQEDLLIIKDYKMTAEKLYCQLGSFIEDASAELTRAGFLVIPSAGIVLEGIESLTSPKNVNFLNAISGWSSKNQHYYYIATGADVGKKVGALLMESYRQFLQAYVPNLQVHFIGHDPNDPTNFAEGMAWWSPEGQAGPHCFSAELKTKSHEG